MAGREERPLVLVDLAVPADVERSAAAVPGVSLFDVDDLRVGLDGALTARLHEVRASRRSSRRRWLRSGAAGASFEVEPLVAELRRRAETVRAQELERALADLGDVDPATAERIEHLSRSLVKKLLHEPTRAPARARGRRRRGRGRGRRARALRPRRPARAVSEPPPRAAVVVGTRGSASPSRRRSGSVRSSKPPARPLDRRPPDRHARRPDAGERRAAPRDRRQGALHRGARAGAPRRHDRPRRPLAEGPPDRGGRRRRARCRLPARGRPRLPRLARRPSAEIPAGAVVGTSSLRRSAQLRALRPDLEVRSIRGNVETRIRKVREGDYDAVLLAAAGIARLGLEHEVAEWLDADVLVPAPGRVRSRSSAAPTTRRRSSCSQPSTIPGRGRRRPRSGRSCGRWEPGARRRSPRTGPRAATRSTWTGSSPRRTGARSSASRGRGPEEVGERLARDARHAGAEAILKAVRG